tara:strand:+ start:496 stop:759 length:264 start_codon:yes stop_codon:yes gene_type:complete
MKIAISKLVQRISSFFPNLKKDIRIAHIKSTPQEFIHNNLKFSLPFSLGLTVLFFFHTGQGRTYPLAVSPGFYHQLYCDIQFFILKT